MEKRFVYIIVAEIEYKKGEPKNETTIIRAFDNFAAAKEFIELHFDGEVLYGDNTTTEDSRWIFSSNTCTMVVRIEPWRIDS